MEAGVEAPPVRGGLSFGRFWGRSALVDAILHGSSSSSMSTTAMGGVRAGVQGTVHAPSDPVGDRGLEALHLRGGLWLVAGLSLSR